MWPFDRKEKQSVRAEELAFQADIASRFKEIKASAEIGKKYDALKRLQQEIKDRPIKEKFFRFGNGHGDTGVALGVLFGSVVPLCIGFLLASPAIVAAGLVLPVVRVCCRH